MAGCSGSLRPVRRSRRRSPWPVKLTRFRFRALPERADLAYDDVLGGRISETWRAEWCGGLRMSGLTRALLIGAGCWWFAASYAAAQSTINPTGDPKLAPQRILALDA